DALQHLVEQRTLELRSANQRLEIEIAERRRAESALQHQLARERLMGAIAQRIRQSLNLDTILDTTVTEVRQFLQTDRVLIYRFEPNWHGSVAVESVADQCLSILGQVVNDPCFMETYIPLYHQGRVKATEDIYASTLTPCHINLLAQFQVRANLVAPILTGEELWGLLIVHQCVGPRPWQPLEIELIKQLADQVGIAIQQAQLYQRLEEVNQELHRLATSDGLTQVANRRRFDQVLEQEWNRMTREKTPLALILCDIDFFKRYNDAYGHPIGDECLQRVAREIYLTAKRSVDLVARYGGEEFVVLLSNTSITGALHVAQEIHFRVKALRIAHVASPYEYVTLSVGVAGIIPNPDSSPAQLLAEADRALYRAKAEGRDRVVCA
ncbi:MAG: diguanylate cyclase, partial [Leptolyngbyaceae bacterium]|nr:diguanylate cyclase [Leptolyngbyaceae bacterium]